MIPNRICLGAMSGLGSVGESASKNLFGASGNQSLGATPFNFQPSNNQPTFTFGQPSTSFNFSAPPPGGSALQQSQGMTFGQPNMGLVPTPRCPSATAAAATNFNFAMSLSQGGSTVNPPLFGSGTLQSNQPTTFTNSSGVAQTSSTTDISRRPIKKAVRRRKNQMP